MPTYPFARRTCTPSPCTPETGGIAFGGTYSGNACPPRPAATYPIPAVGTSPVLLWAVYLYGLLYNALSGTPYLGARLRRTLPRPSGDPMDAIRGLAMIVFGGGLAYAYTPAVLSSGASAATYTSYLYTTLRDCLAVSSASACLSADAAARASLAATTGIVP